MNIASMTREAAEGSKAAQKCLFENLSPRMNVLCRRYIKSREDAEEVLQDGFFNFFKSLPDFNYKNDAGLHAWLKQIMVNQCLMFLRRKTVFNIVTEPAANEVMFEEDVLSNLAMAEIFTLIVALPTGYRTVFNLHEIEGFDHAEISRLLCISEGTSKSQLSRAKNLLQKMLVKKGFDYVRTKTY